MNPLYAYAVGGSFTCGLVQFLYVNGLVVQTVVFVLSAMALCVVSVNRLEAKRIAKDDVAQVHVLVCGAAVAAVAVALGAAVFALVVVPLNPPAQEIKLFTEYYALETVHVRGEQRVEHQENDALVSDDQVEGDKRTNLENDQVDEVSGGQSGEEGAGSSDASNPGSQSYNFSVFGDSTDAVDYFHELSRLLFVIPAVLIVVIMAFSAKVLARRRRFRKMSDLPASRSIREFYRFFDERLPKLGIARSSSATPIEHAQNTTGAVSLFEREADGATFAQLASAYCKCVYGGVEPAADDLECCKKLYRVFYRSARKLVGPARYLRCFFRL